MKDRPDRAARWQLIESMFAGQSWRAAAAQSQLKISRSTAYRLLQLARDEVKAAEAFLDDRHGHLYTLPDKVASVARRWTHQTTAISFSPEPTSSSDQRLHRSQRRVQTARTGSNG